MGFRTRRTKKGPDGGVDFVATMKPIKSLKILVQCKYWPSKKVGVKPVRELYGVVKALRATRGVLITSSAFTNPAISFSQSTPIILIDGRQLEQAKTKSMKHRLRLIILEGIMYDRNISGVDLAQADLSGLRFDFTNLSNANLTNANLENAELRETDFTGADLRGANLRGAFLYQAVFEKADLRGADLSGAIFSYGIGHEWNTARTDPSEINWNDVYMNKTKYNHETKWPDGFDPVKAGAILCEG